MPRTATTLARTHDGKWKVLQAPDVPLIEQSQKFRAFLGSKSHKEFNLIQHQESDGAARIIHLRTPDDQAKLDLQHEAQNAEAKKQADDDLKRPNKEREERDKARAERDSEELDALNKSHAAQPVAPAKDIAGLRTDGPTPEDWVKAGYKLENYPPKGYAAKPAAAAP